ncbi:MAG: DUF3703 domain-containing protein [Acidobacteria bacterium]|nr:DUF3703 domain-containing protein [Acidobacteriota bacterium]
MKILDRHINEEVSSADECSTAGDLTTAFGHLERAHVLGQASTYDHTRVHWRMFKLALQMRSPREIVGQIVRIVGAATKTPFGIYPLGNTGGANVWFFKPMPIPDDLRDILNKAER